MKTLPLIILFVLSAMCPPLAIVAFVIMLICKT